MCQCNTMCKSNTLCFHFAHLANNTETRPKLLVSRAHTHIGNFMEKEANKAADGGEAETHN